MTLVETLKIKAQTHWPDEIISAIASMEEAEIYMKAGLKAARIGNRWALIRSDINWSDYSIRRNTWLKNKLADYDSWKDYNNADLIGEGFPPRDSNGDPYELHHIGQRQNQHCHRQRLHLPSGPSVQICRQQARDKPHPRQQPRKPVEEPLLRLVSQYGDELWSAELDDERPQYLFH